MKHKFIAVIFSILVVSLMLACSLSAGTATPGSSPMESNNPTTGGAPNWGQRTKTSGCQAMGVLPDPACTPGDILPDATKAKICVSGYSTTVRDVPDSVKTAVYKEYGIKTHTSGQYEVDHFVSLELGGSNDISNLWPEPAAPTPGFHEKDKVENYLHDQVCSGAMTLKDAQIKIATNWLDVYNSMSK
jgi:hypothetical protein